MRDLSYRSFFISINCRGRIYFVFILFLFYSYFPKKGVTTSIISAQDEKFEGTIVVNDEYASLVPSLSIGEFESLKQSIKEDELTYAIIVNEHSVILDGYQRYKACQELGK